MTAPSYVDQGRASSQHTVTTDNVVIDPWATAGPAGGRHQFNGSARPWWRSPWLLPAVGVAVAVLAGFFLLRALLGPGTGASSPEEAVEGLFEAAAAQDPIGVLRMVNPAEVRGLDDVYRTASAKTQEAGLTSPGGLVDGVDLELTGLELDAQQLSEHVYRVDIEAGDLAVSVDPDAFPESLRPVGEEIGRDTFRTSVSELWVPFAEANELPTTPSVIVVEIDGAWHVSPLATGAELYSHYLGQPGGDYDAYERTLDEPDPVVGRDPEDALVTLAEAVSSNDPSRMVDALPADEAGLLQAFTGQARTVLTQYEIGGEVTLDSLDTEEADADDGLVRLDVEQAVAQGSAYGQGEYIEGEVALDDRCLEISGDRECLPPAFGGIFGVDGAYVLVREVGEEYQVDPGATIASYAEDIVEATSVEDLLSLFEADYLLPATPATPGEATTVPLNSFGRGAVTVSAEAGQVVVAGSSVLADSPDVYGPSNPSDYLYETTASSWPGDDLGVSATLAEESGEYRFVFSDDFEELSPTGGSAEVGVEVIDAPVLGAGETMPSQYDGTGVALYDLPAGDYDLSDSLSVPGCYDGDPCALDAGTYLAVGTGSIDVAAEPAYVADSSGYSGSSLDVGDGYGYVEGTTGSDGSTDVTLVPPPGSSDITLTVTGSSDLVLSTVDIDNGDLIESDNEGSDGSESISIYTISDDPWTIEVSDYYGGAGEDFSLDVYVE